MISDPVRLAFAPPHVWRETAPPDGGPPLNDDAAMPIQGHTTFNEMLRALNPLQHIPVIGTIYRAVTGDDIQPAFRVLGGAIFGGPIGMITAAASTAVEQFEPVRRLRMALNGEPDPYLTRPGASTALSTTPADVLAAYRRWTAPPAAPTPAV